MITQAMNEATRMPDGRETAPSLPSHSPAQSVETDTYILRLNEIGLTDEQSRTLHAVLDTIAKGFVEYGWSGEVCGELLEGFQAVLSNAVEPLESPDQNHEEKGDRSA